MGTVLVAYDLNRPEQDYVSLFEGIKKCGTTWWHHLDSTWLITTDKSAKDVRDLLADLLDKSDELLVIDVTGRPRAWRGFNERGSRWLKVTYA